MRNIVLVLLLSVFILSALGSAHADEVFTVVADSTFSGHAGYVLTVESSYGGGQSVFAYDDAGMLRIYAFRDYGSQTWNIQNPAQYLTPTQSMSIGQTWNYLQNEQGDVMTAEVVDFVGVTVAAGFFSAYLVDITNQSQPSEIAETIWFSEGVGFVRNLGYVFGGGGAIDWEDQLSSYDIVGGSGFMPLAVGNTWSFVEISVPSPEQSWGDLKAAY